MGKILISFTEKKDFSETEEFLKFLEFWDRSVMWVQLIDPADRADFRLFIASKYHGVTDASRIIVERILDAIPVSHRTISGTQLLLQCFPKGAELRFEKKIEKLAKELTRIVGVVQNYMKYAELDKDVMSQQRFFLLYLKKKNNYELYNAATRKFKDELDEQPFKFERALNHWWVLDQEYYNPNNPLTENNTASLLKLVSALETVSQLYYLRYYLEAISHNVKLKDAELDLLKAKIEPMLSYSETQEELVQLYVLAINMTRHNDLTAYGKFEALYNKYHLLLEKTDHLYMIKSMVNLLYRNFSVNGDGEVGKLTFQWMLKAWTFGLYENEGSINDGDYLNFLVVALFLGEKEKLAEFREKYDPLLDASVVKEVQTICDARLLFEDRQYNESLSVLNPVFPIGSTFDPKYDLRVRALRIMIYLEMLWNREELDPQNYPPKIHENSSVELNDLLDSSTTSLKQYCWRMKKKEFDRLVLSGNQRFSIIVSYFLEYAMIGPGNAGEKEKARLKRKIANALKKDRPLTYRIWLNKRFRLLDDNE